MSDHESLPPATRDAAQEKERVDVVVPEIAELRQRMKSAMKESGRTLTEIGMKMGYTEKKAAKNAVWYLLNKCENPGLRDVFQFCQAVNMRFSELFLASPDCQI